MSGLKAGQATDRPDGSLVLPASSGKRLLPRVRMIASLNASPGSRIAEPIHHRCLKPDQALAALIGPDLVGDRAQREGGGYP